MVSDTGNDAGRTDEEPRGARDGRVARGERTRARILAAHTELLREGELRPTAAVIAGRAGVSVRALWLNFKDFEGLLGETTTLWLASDGDLAETVGPEGDLTDRVRAYCAQRARRHEHMAPATRSATIRRPFSVALQQSRRWHLERLAHELSTTFAPELEAAGAARELLETSLATTAGISAWLYLRDDLGLSTEAATEVLRFELESLLRAPLPAP